jgi:hypothetical protein
MPRRTARANGRKSAVRAAVEHVFARQKGPMGLYIRTIGFARARTKIGLANLAYNSAAQGSGPVGGERGGWVLAADVCGGDDCRHSGAPPDRSSGGERQDCLGRDRRPVRKDRCCVVAGS